MKKIRKNIIYVLVCTMLSLVILQSAFLTSFAVTQTDSRENYKSYISLIGKYFPNIGKYMQRLLSGKTGTTSPVEISKETGTLVTAPSNKDPQKDTPEEADALSFYESEVLRLVNEQRAHYGLRALKNDMRLVRLARLKSKDMHDLHYFSHESPTYGRAFDMMKKSGIGYSNAGENIAMGYPTPEQVVNAWMNSPGHRMNILSEKYTSIGIGYEKDGHYCTQMFIG